MKTLADLCASYQIPKIKKGGSEFSSLMEYFIGLKMTDKTGKLFTYASLGKILKDRGMTTVAKLYRLKRELETAKNPPAFFWYLMDEWEVIHM